MRKKLLTFCMSAIMVMGINTAIVSAKGGAMCNCPDWERSRIVKVYDYAEKHYVLKCLNCGWSQIAP